jgi:hypothetical protein
MKRTLTAEDIIDNESFCMKRTDLQKQLLALKKDRRIGVGPDATFYFENHQTLCWQIQEMLRIEKGGDEQLKDELTAYLPLLPRQFDDGSMEFVATFMIEIEDLERRFKALQTLGGIDRSVQIILSSDTIQGTPENELERTTEDGQTSAVHFIRFKLSPKQIDAFRQVNQNVILQITHPNYSHKTLLTETQRIALAHDLI